MTSDNDMDVNPRRPSLSPASSTISRSSASENEQAPQSPHSRPVSRRSRSERPKLLNRHSSSSIIVPKGRDVVQTERPEYPPDDARNMSPRRNSQDLETLEHDVREALKNQARTLQSSLAALAERIDEVRADHDKLESENRFLQDYIGGLTRTMSKEPMSRTASMSRGKKSRK